MSDKQINTAVILAAGLGSRFGKRTKELPKGFIKIGNESLIERSIRILKEQGIENIVVGTGHKNEHYQSIKEKHNLTIYENPEYATTGSVYTFTLAEPFVSSDILLLESDLLYQPEAIRLLLEDNDNNVILTSGYTQSGDEVYVSADEHHNLLNLSKKPEHFDNIIGELVGISKISHSLLKDLVAFVGADSLNKRLDYEMGIVHLSKKQNVKALLNESLVWCEVDDETHLERAIRDIYPRL